MKILSAKQVRDWDIFTIENEPITSLGLMERAAEKCTEWISIKCSANHSIKIFCGKGNNGGDGLAIARQLAQLNYKVDVYILEFGSLGTTDFQANLARLHEIDLPIHFIQSAEFFPTINTEDIVIDALFGTGVNRPLAGLSAELVEFLNHSQVQVISIDMPSGMITDAPTLPNLIVKANTTLTFQQPKLCFFIPENEPFFGITHVLNIGLNSEYLKNLNSDYNLTDLYMMKAMYKPRKKFSHKGTYGHALIVAGSKGKMGAAILCGKACLRSGAGLTTAMVPGSEMTIIQTALPVAMAISHTELIDTDLSKFTVIAIGPGLGTLQHACDLIDKIIHPSLPPMVIDADGLNILSKQPELFSKIPHASILTPHPKEFERMFGKSNNHFEKMEMASKKAKEFGLYIIIKGANSFLACPNGEKFFNSTGNPGMATAGSGDVLTGMIAGLLAQGYASKEACLLGIYLHGLSGDIGAMQVSKESLIATDIIKYIGKAFFKVAYSK